MQGRWYTTGAGSHLPPLLTIAIVIIAAGSAAEAVASILTALLITAAIAITVITVGAAAFIVHRVRHPDTRLIPQPRYHMLSPGPGPEATGRSQPPMIVNNYFGGTHTHGSGPGQAAVNHTPLIAGAITGSGPRNGPAA